MLRLYYSGAASYLKEQKDPFKSLGGFVSSSPVPNNVNEAFFADISNYSIQNDLTETKLLVLKNEGNATISDIMLYWIQNPASLLKLSISTIVPNAQNCGTGCEYYFEKISSVRSVPVFSQEFYDASSSKPTAIIELATPAQIGEVITLLGVSTGLAMSNLTIDQTYKLIEKAFKNNTTYTVVFVNETNELYNQNGDPYTEEVKYLLITREDVLEDTSPVTFSTTGTATLKQNKSFAGGEDNAVNIGDIEVGKYLGIWFKKEIDIDKYEDLNQDTCSDFSKNRKSDITDNMELYFKY